MRGYIYRHLFNYKTIGERKSYIVTDKKLKEYIDSFVVTKKHENIDDVIILSLQITSSKLCFREAKNAIDPNVLINTTNAHCIGYSAFFSATCNYLLDKYGYSSKWTSKPLIGQIYFINTNIHNYFKSSFFKDHDYNVIINSETGERFYVDPTINDYFKIDYVAGE